jgi:hypothetical protein
MHFLRQETARMKGEVIAADQRKMQISQYPGNVRVEGW